MPRLIASLNGMVVQDFMLKESRTTLGRRSTNDIVLTDMAVSGEHAAFTYEKKIGIVVVEDLGSTNGTRVNGIKVRRQVLQSGDLLDIGKCRIRFLMSSIAPEGGSPNGGFYTEALSVPVPHMQPENASHEEGPSTSPAEFPPHDDAPYTAGAHLRAVKGADEDVMLSKIVTTVGRPGIAVVALTKRGKGYVITKVDGNKDAKLNGKALDTAEAAVKGGDKIELAGMEYEFLS